MQIFDNSWHFLGFGACVEQGYKKGKASSGKFGLKIDGKLSFDKLKVAKKFNSFFITAASKLVEKLPQSFNKFRKNFVESFYRSKDVFPNSFSFSIVSENKVLKYLNSLGINKATGLDDIPSRFVRDGASIIACPLTNVINLSLIQGAVPDDLKSARVVPLFKKSDKTEVGNYRSVSILTIILEFERVVYDQVESYLIRRNFFINFSQVLKDICLTHLIDFIKFQMDQGHFVGMVLLDLQKAFDTVDHGILLMKLKALCLSQDVSRWFPSYSSDPQRLVDVLGTLSSHANIFLRGVPQGSILRPLSFLIYVNDMSDAVNNTLLLYADDSAILVADKCLSNIETVLQIELEIVSKWLVDNKHLGKTESILFGSRPRLKSQSVLSITCKGIVIEAKTTVKYLGVLFKQCLSGANVATFVIQKANTRLKFLYR